MKNFKYSIIEGKVIITEYTGNNLNVVVPSIIEVNDTKYDVTEIGEWAFSNSNIKSITIPSSVTTIGSYAFDDCKKLTKIYYLGTIEDWCNIKFKNKYSNPMSYASHFYMLNENNKYKEVTSIEIPSTITTIDDYQFYGFDNVTSITIPSSVTSIRYNAFSNCSKLTSIIIPSSVIRIGYKAFEGCYGLTINCEAKDEPDDWDVYWNYNEWLPVRWGYKNDK